MSKSSPYLTALSELALKPSVTIAAGTTCACLGDERNLREFLVADEAARRLRREGHTVFSLIIDDSFDPLNLRQLRVAVNKDPDMLERYEPLCGKPIGMLPDLWGCHESYAAHFEHCLMERLHNLGCHPTLISTANAYQHGQYAPYIQIVLARYQEILDFLSSRFEGYQPEKLLWVVCPHCSYMDETQIERVEEQSIHVHCSRCANRSKIDFEAVIAKLNWKLDCAARWTLYGIDAEPFSKSYLEPKTGTFAVAQALSIEFFGGKPVVPLRYGLVKMDRSLSYKLLETLPPDMLRSLMVENPSSDLNLTSNLIATTASRYKVLPGMSYQEVIKQLIPMWLLTPESLTRRQRELLTHGIAFSREFLGYEVQLRLPTVAQFQNASPSVLKSLQWLLQFALNSKETDGHSWEAFEKPVKDATHALGENRNAVLHLLRSLIGQEQGAPAARMLFLLPTDYICLMASMLHLYSSNSKEINVVPYLQLAS